jgi:hypothetical protein
MQIALVAVVLLAGMWFTVLKPKSAGSSSAPAAQKSEPVAPGVRGLTAAIDRAHAAAATSDAANAKIQAATGGSTAAATSTASATASPKTTATATKTKAVAKAKHAAVTKKATTRAAAKRSGTKTATKKAVASKPATTTKTSKATAAKPVATTTTSAATTPAADVDPSDRLLAYLKKGKTLVVLFYGTGAVDSAARTAVHQLALSDPKHVVSAYVPIAKVGDYSALTSDIDILASPTVLIVGTNGKATPLTGYVDADVLRNAVAAARAASSAK